VLIYKDDELFSLKHKPIIKMMGNSSKATVPFSIQYFNNICSQDQENYNPLPKYQILTEMSQIMSLKNHTLILYQSTTCKLIDLKETIVQSA